MKKAAPREGERGIAPLPIPFGNVRDAPSFYNSLVPRQRASAVPRALVPVVDCVLLNKGRLVRWICTGEEGEATEKLSTDREALFRVFKKCSASEGNAAHLMAVTRKIGESRPTVLDEESTGEFLKHGLTSSEGQACVAIHGIVWPKGGDRAVYRNIYAMSRDPNGGPATTLTMRVPEVLSPEVGQRSEMPETRSYHDSLNEALDELTRRCIVQLEGALRTKVTYAAIDYVVDEGDKPWLLWPHNVRTLDVSAGGTLEVAAQVVAPPSAPKQLGDTTSTAATSAAAAAFTPTTHSTSHGGGVDPEDDWVAEKARLSEEAAAQQAAVEEEFRALKAAHRVGDGGRGSILIVDVDASAVVAATQALAQEGFSVTIVDDAGAALTLTRTTTFDAILMARDLPSLSGIEAVKLLRTREASRTPSRPGLTGATAYHLTVVAFTPQTSPEDLNLYRMVGFDGCVAKPVDPIGLLSTMGAAVPAPANFQPRPPPSTSQMESAARSRALGGGSGMSFSIPPNASSSSSSFSSSLSPSFAPYNPTTPQVQLGGGGLSPSGGGGGGGTLVFPPSSPMSNSDGAPLSFSPHPPSTPGGASALQGVRGARSMAANRRGAGTSPRRGRTSPRRQASGEEGMGMGMGIPTSNAVTVGADGQVIMPVGAAIPGIEPPTGPSIGGASRGATAGVTAGLPVPEDTMGGSRLGVFQLDAETALPYCVMGERRPGVPLFHFVVVNDIFDTYEQHQILFKKIVASLPGLRVLLFNYPGQAYTEWRRDVVLNNEYLAGVLQSLMTYVGPGGTREFDLSDNNARLSQFHLVGVGNGGAIANYFAAAYAASHPNLRGITLINGFAHVDSHFAGVMHDCMNVFACSPTTRPDLPVYFFARFLFSPTYLQKVGAPLALNLYTAVSNPITLQGRIALCQGALSHVDTRPALYSIPIPYIIVASSKDGLVKPSHVAVLVEARGGEVRSIKRALNDKAKAVVVWLRAGHEVFQEARKPLVNLFQQLAVGYHERNDVAFLPIAPEDADGSGNRLSAAMAASEGARGRGAAMAAQATALGTMTAASAAAARGVDPLAKVPGGKAPTQVFEDRFLDNVVATMRNTALTSKYTPNLSDARGGLSNQPRTGAAASPSGSAAAMESAASSYQLTDVNPALLEAPPLSEEFVRFKPGTAVGARGGARGKSPSKSGAASGAGAGTAGGVAKSMMLDPTVTAFEKRESLLRKKTASGSPVSSELPEVKEYMSWRVKRNTRRFQRISACATAIQRAWKSYLARTLVVRMRQQRAALNVQRWFRGCLGRGLAREKKKRLWAVRVVQRYYRGFKGRAEKEMIKRKKKAAIDIQRAFRGFKGREIVRAMREKKRRAATIIQAGFRRAQAIRKAVRVRKERNAAVNIQRVWNGYKGRSRARKERDRYVFAKNQSQGIEFGRQMLMEHKLHGTRLQSEVALLTKEKLACEEKVEAVLSEIATFEQGVRALEKEMVELSRAEAEAAGTLDKEAKTELRNNKVRLDREFAAQLVKIADRRETLTALETKLQQLDRARLAKKEELKDLERKLVVLLDQQQEQLKNIRQRQERRSENMVTEAIGAVNDVLAGRNPGGAESLYPTTKGGGGGGGEGGTRAPLAASLSPLVEGEGEGVVALEGVGGVVGGG